MTSDAYERQIAPQVHEQEAEKLVQLEDENLQLKRAVHSHATVDQAIGVVLAVGELTPDEGWDVLREISQRTNVKVRYVAELIVEWARTGELPGDIKSELERELRLSKARVRTGDRAC